jgi:hypothetical protein
MLGKGVPVCLRCTYSSQRSLVSLVSLELSCGRHKMEPTLKAAAGKSLYIWHVLGYSVLVIHFFGFEFKISNCGHRT